MSSRVAFLGLAALLTVAAVVIALRSHDEPPTVGTAPPNWWVNPAHLARVINGAYVAATHRDTARSTCSALATKGQYSCSLFDAAGRPVVTVQASVMAGGAWITGSAPPAGQLYGCCV